MKNSLTDELENINKFIYTPQSVTNDKQSRKSCKSYLIESNSKVVDILIALNNHKIVFARKKKLYCCFEFVVALSILLFCITVFEFTRNFFYKFEINYNFLFALYIIKLLIEFIFVEAFCKSQYKHVIYQKESMKMIEDIKLNLREIQRNNNNFIINID